MARLFAIMPISGIRQTNPKFKWFTAYALFSLCYILIVYMLAFLQSRQTLNGKVNTSNSGKFNIFVQQHYDQQMKTKNILHFNSQGGIIFFISVILSFHLFFIMARKWNKLILNWREKEEIFLHAPYKRNGWLLRWKIRAISAVFLGLAFGKTFFSLD